MINSFLPRHGVNSLILLASVLLSHSASAQNVAGNIRPVGSICLAGQACVGTVAGTMTDASAEVSIADAAESAVEAEVTELPEAVAEAAAEPPVDAGSMEVAAATSDFDAAGAYQMSCNACHGTGAAGAPMLGDTETWEARMEKGMDALMSNVVNGVGAMPARGICLTCSDEDLQAIVNYMLAQN